MNNDVPSFLNRSSSFLQVTRITLKAWMRLNLGKILSPTTELAALERLNVVTTLVPSYVIDLNSCW